MATCEEARAGFGAGITSGTQLFNAMPPLGHRAPGLAGALLADERASLSLIADGVHVHPGTVALAWRLAGPGRMVLITDAMAALGMPPGRYQLGDLEVLVDETSARLGDGRLAGSVLSLDQAARNLMAFTGCSLAEAVTTMTETPARLLGLSGERGRVAVDCAADLVLLGADLRVVKTIVAGQIVQGRT
jgi:N-acetylglucosamine-6-phosphate deacetylase